MKNSIHFNAPYLIDANGKNIPCDLKVSKKKFRIFYLVLFEEKRKAERSGFI